MTEERKTKIIDEFLTWMIEHHNNDEDLYLTLRNSIGLTQEELHEFDIESLDEYYEREHEKEKQETIDTMTGEDVMEATAYMANAPDCCSAEEKAENVLGMLGANIIDESIYHTEDEHDAAVGETAEETEIDYEKEVVESVETDYKHEVIESVDKEFKAYEADLLDGSKTVEEVYAHSYESMVKAELRDTICGEVEFNDNVYKALYEERGKILEGLHQDFVGQPHASVNSFEETGFFIEDYCNRYHGEIMREPSEDTGMSMG